MKQAITILKWGWIILIRLAFTFDFLFLGGLWYLAPNVGVEKLIMTVPLIILAILAVVAYQFSHWNDQKVSTIQHAQHVKVTQAIIEPMSRSNQHGK